MNYDMKDMEEKIKVNVSISVATDGFYSAYCTDYPVIFGSGNTPSEAIEELKETLSLIKKDGRDVAFVYPEWLDSDYEFIVGWNIQDLMSYYAGIITPAALGRLSGIHPKQIWAYMHGKTKPRKAQLEKMESALHRLGEELVHTSFC